MPSSLLSHSSDIPHHTFAARQNLIALQQTLAQIGKGNADPALRSLVAEGLSRCAQLEQFFDRHLAPKADGGAVVDAQVFERLMMLAGPDTARELLDQLLADLDAAHSAIAAAAPQLDWPTLRAQCHILVAVAGSVGAIPVLRAAEILQAAQKTDSAAATQIADTLLIRLQSLISFVQAERLSRAVA